MNNSLHWLKNWCYWRISQIVFNGKKQSNLNNRHIRIIGVKTQFSQLVSKFINTHTVRLILKTRICMNFIKTGSTPESHLLKNLNTKWFQFTKVPQVVKFLKSNTSYRSYIGVNQLENFQSWENIKTWSFSLETVDVSLIHTFMVFITSSCWKASNVNHTFS